MTRIILFSGGVESAALLPLANKGDTLLMVEPFHGPDVVFFVREKALKLAAHYGMKVEIASFKLPAGVRPVQMWALSRIASLWVSTFTNTKEVWWGRNKDDIKPHMAVEHERIVESWQVAHPNVPLLWPLSHLSKAETWEAIPQEIRPLVHSCIHVAPCGVCGKCQERVSSGIPVS
jgi:7-cyano-7-deazaguanine synthase in queuosine biosynthesis